MTRENVFCYDSMEKWLANEIEQVKKEYNYKVVDFKKDQKEYIFNNSDLVKDFSKDEYRNVQITLMAEFSDTEKLAISNTIYLSLNTKKGVLEQLSNEENKDETYFWYYDSNNLEEYLEKISENMTRSQYKILLERAEKRVKNSNTKNEDNMKITLESIKQESDFKKYTNTYFVYSETKNLLNILLVAIKNQIQNIRAYDAIDAIFK